MSLTLIPTVIHSTYPNSVFGSDFYIYISQVFIDYIANTFNTFILNTFNSIRKTL